MSCEATMARPGRRINDANRYVKGLFIDDCVDRGGQSHSGPRGNPPQQQDALSSHVDAWEPGLIAQ